MKNNRLIFALLFGTLALFMASCTAGDMDEGYIEPEENWEDQGNVEDVILELNESGFDIYILEEITTNNKLGIPAFEQLKQDLEALGGLLPAAVMNDLKRHPIHVVNVVGTDVIRYDNDPASLYYDAIVINDIGVWNNQVTRNQPMLLFRYMAELYYDKYMTGAQKSTVQAAYDAIGSKYEQVYRSTGIKLETEKVASPAADDVVSYFLETSEAYFDSNDYYPFDYQELERYDPAGLAAVAAVWGQRTVEANPYGVMLPPADLIVGAGWYARSLDEWHRKCIFADCNGYQYPIVGSRFVADSVFVQAKAILEGMSTDKQGTTWMQQAMAQNKAQGYYIGIVGRSEINSDLPELDTWANGAYGYGSTPNSPMLMIVERDICMPGVGGAKGNQSLLCHEFGHNIQDGLGRLGIGFNETVEALYTKNVTNGGMYAGNYADNTWLEYWAESTTAWYNAGNSVETVSIDTGDIVDGQPVLERKAIVTREDLRAYDPEMYELISIYYPDDVKLTGFHFDW